MWETSQTLFWAAFGLIDLDNFELTGIKEFTRFWGLIMFGSFSIINIIVLLNLLIAMMNHSYQLISVSSVGPSSSPDNTSVFPISQTCCFNVLASTLSSQLMYYFSPPFHFTSPPCPSYMYVYRSLSLSSSSQYFNRLFTSNIQKYIRLPTKYSLEIFIYNLCNSLD